MTVTKDTRKTHDDAIAEEWERLSSNPDNVIVSDVLKGALPFLDENPEVLVHLSGPEARSSTLRIYRFARVDVGWLVVAAATLREALRFVKVPGPAWTDLEIKHENQTLRGFSLASWSLEPCVDFSESEGASCTVTLTLRSRHREQTRVL